MIVLKSEAEIDKIRRASRIVAETLERLKEVVKPGVTTLDLDKLAEEMIRRHQAKPAFKGYRGYQATLCTSINEEVVHGIPSKKRVLKEGDIIGVDCGAIVEGFYGDAAKTFLVGQADQESRQLVKVTEESLERGIEQMKVGNRLHDISWAVQEHAERHGYTVVRDFVGHGIGRQLHEEPQVPNFGTSGSGIRLTAGLVLAIEPMVNIGRAEVTVLEDGWTAVTLDGKRSAHFEHTVALTEQGTEILSRI